MSARTCTAAATNAYVALHGLFPWEAAGLVRLTTARQTGTIVGVYDNRLAGFDEDIPELRWASVCEVHGALVHHSSRRNAEGWAGLPADWCDECQAALDGASTPAEVLV